MRSPGTVRGTALTLFLSLLAACDSTPEPGRPPAPATGAGDTVERTPTSAGRQEAPPTRSAPRAPGPAAAKDERRAAGEGLSPMPATVARATELKAEPFLDAKTVAPLAAGSMVTVLARSGGWYRVAADGREGWVRLLNVSTQTQARGLGAEELESAARIATGRQGGGNIASTTGVRGLTPEQLREAKPAPEQLERLEQNAVGEQEALAYARAHGLERRKIPFLPESE